jgi:glycosyltransferase involved in cell wall biosynthesis
MSISFVVPVHNTGLYLERCLRSLTRTRIMRSEIIVVDDASTDNSIEIVERFRRTTPVQVRIVNTGGTVPASLGAARNLGLSLADCEYIAFIDSDDWISLAIYEEAALLADRLRADFAWVRSISYNQMHSTFSSFNDQSHRDFLLQGRPFFLTNGERDPVLGMFEPSTCNRVFRRSFLKAISFSYPVGILYEDLIPHIQLLFAAKRVAVIGHTGYYYRTFRPGKLTDRNDEKRRDILQTIDRLASVFDENKSSSMGAYMAAYLVRFVSWCISAIPFELRDDFVKQAKQRMSILPQAWVTAAKRLEVWPGDPFKIVDDHSKSSLSKYFLEVAAQKLSGAKEIKYVFNRRNRD